MDGFMAGQATHHAGKILGIAGSDDDVVDPGEYRPVDRAQHRHLDLPEVVDPHDPAMTLLGQEHLDEVGGDGELLERSVGARRERAHVLERLVLGLAARHEVGVDDALGDVSHREVRQCSAHVAVDVAELQAASHHDLEDGSRYDAESPVAGNGVGELPAGYGDSHTSLDDDG